MMTAEHKRAITLVTYNLFHAHAIRIARENAKRLDVDDLREEILNTADDMLGHLRESESMLLALPDRSMPEQLVATMCDHVRSALCSMILDDDYTNALTEQLHIKYK